MFASKLLAQVEYHGSASATGSCLRAIARLLSSGVSVSRARLVTGQNRHGFYVEGDEPDPILIRAGFTSGYSGEGPAGLAVALRLFQTFGVEIEEVSVEEAVLERIDTNQLTDSDIRLIRDARVVRPFRIYDYVHSGLIGREERQSHVFRNQFDHVVPWAVLDSRIVDLAMQLRSDPDKAVFDAFRRLESTIVSRCGFPLGVSGAEVFKKAFRGSGALLTWNDASKGELEGRAQLFEAAFMAFRNPRAHRERPTVVSSSYREFYLVNQLFCLEAEAVEV